MQAFFSKPRWKEKAWKRKEKMIKLKKIEFSKSVLTRGYFTEAFNINKHQPIPIFQPTPLSLYYAFFLLSH